MPVDPQIHGVKPFQECFPETKSTESIAKHPEAKCADPSGAPCSKQSIGLLGRRHVAIDSIIYIGKESNRLEEVQEQSLLDPDAVYTEYPDPRRNEWATRVLPKLKAMPLRELMGRTALPRSTLQAIRGGRRPHPRRQQFLVELLRTEQIQTEHELLTGKIVP